MIRDSPVLIALFWMVMAVVFISPYLIGKRWWPEAPARGTFRKLILALCLPQLLFSVSGVVFGLLAALNLISLQGESGAFGYILGFIVLPISALTTLLSLVVLALGFVMLRQRS